MTTDDTQYVTLGDGRAIAMRPISADDGPALQRFHSHLSRTSVHYRFFGAKPTLSQERARYFTHLDGHDRFALVALDPAQPIEIIGVVRFDRIPGTDQAEYAAVIADAWQHQRLGTLLTQQLIAAARQRGIQRLFALVLPDNLPMQRLLLHLGLPERTSWEDGVKRMELDLRVGAEQV
jgi:RimJ/RimL family protein N-acetyltransferase